MEESFCTCLPVIIVDMVETEVDSDAISCEVESGELVTQTVLRAVSVFRNREMTALEEPLYDTIDPDALDSLFNERSTGTLTFEYCGCVVTVHTAGTVYVQDARTVR